MRYLLGLLALVAALLPASPAAGAAPVLVSAGVSGGFATAAWTLPPGVESTFVEVATSPATEADGSFPCCAFPPLFENGVLEPGQTSWTGERKLPPGTYHVHVQGLDRPCFFAGNCPVREWSQIKSFVVGQAGGGGGGGGPTTRAEAVATVLDALAPEGRPGAIVVFALPKALGPRTQVTEAISGKRIGKGKRGALGRRSWLVWADLAPYARFEHPSRIYVVDAANGRILATRDLGWWPLVNGKPPPWQRSPQAFEDGRYRVYSNLPEPTPARAPAHAPGADPVPGGGGALGRSCLLTVGLRTDPSFRADFEGMEGFAKTVGMRVFRAGHATVLDRVAKAKSAGCKEILFYVSAHGAGSGTARVVVSPQVRGQSPRVLPAAWLRDNVLRRNRDVDFTVLVDACHSGRFVNVLRGEPNLLVAQSASSAGGVSWSTLPTVYRDGFDVRLIRRDVANPGRGEFTHGILVGLERFLGDPARVAAADATGDSLLAQALVAAETLGADSDGARRAGLTTPRTWTSPALDEPAPPPPPFRITSASVPDEVVINGARANLQVSWEGSAAFPVTMVYAPDSCSAGVNCTAPTRTFTSPGNPLVFVDAVWCVGDPAGAPLFFDYSVYLVDENGARTQRVSADFLCVA